MSKSPGWFARVEEKRKRDELSVEKVLKRLKMKRASYYDYRSHPDRHPRSKDTIDKIADFLGEDPAALWAEMAPIAGPPPTVFLEAAAARELNTRLYQQHVRALAHVLGMGGGGPRAQGVDVTARLLQEFLSDAASSTGTDPVDHVIAVAPTGRGLKHRESTYQFQIYVMPREHAAGSRAEPEIVLERTRSWVDEAMNGAMLPVVREHSPGLMLQLFRGKSDILIYPGLL